MAFRHPSLNRTILELKLCLSDCRAGLANTLNRTILELKPVTNKRVLRELETLNRTILELKLFTPSGISCSGNTLNRTILELKLAPCQVGGHSPPSQSHHIGIETRDKFSLMSKFASSQSHHIGIETRSGTAINLKIDNTLNRTILELKLIMFVYLRLFSMLSIAPYWN